MLARSVALGALLHIAPAAAQAPPPNDYHAAANWLCLPGRADACTTDQSATAVAADGTTTPVPWRAAAAPKIDCFYAYPTVSPEPMANSDMVPGPAERAVVSQQFARFAARCRLFAPMYRQVTLAGLRSETTGTPLPGLDRDLAYHDVRDAWTAYLRDHNRGRGVVLIGHSQGAMILKRLLAEDIDGKPVQRQLVLAILPGNNLLVPAGRVSGGDLPTIPLCTAKGQRGCVISFVTFRADAPPPANSRFGRTTATGMKVACVNPAALGGGGSATESYLPTVPVGRAGQPPFVWARGATIATPFVTVPGLISTECVDRDDAQYLALTLHPDPAGKRTGTLAGDVVIAGAVRPEWGLHIVDLSASMGNLLDDVAAAER